MNARRRRSFRRLRLVISLAPVLLLFGVALILLELRSGRVPLVALLGLGLAAAGCTLWIYAVAFVHRMTGAIDLLQHHLHNLSASVDSKATISMPVTPEVADLVATVQLLAERLQSTARAEASERRLLETILDAIPSAVLVVGPDRRIRMMNERARILLGVRRTDVPFETYLRDIRLVRALDAALEGGGADSFEISVRDGEPRDLSGVVLPLDGTVKDDARVRGGAVITLHDVSHIRRLERARRDLIANVSHELKTPVAIIRGFAETLREGALDQPEGLDFLRRIEEESERVGRLVDRLLLLARLEQPAFQPRLARIDCTELLAELVAARRPLAERQAVALRYERPAGSLFVDADAELLRQAVSNLLENALRHTPEGGRITVRAAADRENAVISVVDTGPGLAPELRERVFERFYRVDASRARQSGGTGLGLAIVKHIAQVHGGHASVDSRPGEGATFRVALPLASGRER